MSTKLKFVTGSALSMSLIPLVFYYISGLIQIPFLGFVIALGYNLYYIFLGPVQVLNLYLNDAFHMSGDNPAIYHIVGFVIWFIIGSVWGLILYYIRLYSKKDKSKIIKFGVGAVITTIIVQAGVGYTLTYLLALLSNAIKYH